MKITAAADPRAVAEVAAAEIARWLNDAVEQRGRASIAFSRVSEPYDLFTALAALAVPWGQVHLFQVDERIAPDGDPDRNAVALEAFAAGLDPRPTVHLMPVNPPEPEAYAVTLRAICDDVLDVVHLGLGPDGHTASWPPGYGIDDITDRDVALCPEYQHRRRLSLTVPCVNRARWIVLTTSGDGKRPALDQLRAGDPTIPASRVRRGDDTWIVADGAALGS
jgi:6-phosphogluconolactonase